MLRRILSLCKSTVEGPHDPQLAAGKGRIENSAEDDALDAHRQGIEDRVVSNEWMGDRYAGGDARHPHGWHLQRGAWHRTASDMHNPILHEGLTVSLRTLQIDDQLFQYVLAHSVREHPAQAALREATRTHRYAGMQIAADQGQLMALLIKLLGARRTIEIGTFTGYSALAVALALPDEGRVLACDISDEYTRIGRPFWQQAGVDHKIELVLAPAQETLDARLAAGQAGTYDFAFIDADKANYDNYYERCLALVRAGGLIAFDNMLWGGAVARPAKDADTAALQALNAKLQCDERIDHALLTVGDGLALARKR